MKLKKLLDIPMPRNQRADLIFGGQTSKAKEAFLQLSSFEGGIEEACELLGKQKELEQYQADFDRFFEEDTKKALMLQKNFIEKLRNELALKFKI